MWNGKISLLKLSPSLLFSQIKLTGQSMHVDSFRNESQIILAFSDFILHKKQMPLLHVVFFEVRKLLFSFKPDIATLWLFYKYS